jgi:hypothetical protein
MKNSQARAEVSDIAEKVRADQALERNYTKNFSGNTRGGSAGGDKKFIKPAYKKGGVVSSASKRADGCAVKGKTKGRIV